MNHRLPSRHAWRAQLLVGRPLLGFVLLAAWLAVFALVQPAQAEPKIPELRAHVSDEAGVLTEVSRLDLETQLTEYERATGHQFAFLSVRTLEGSPIEDFAMRVAEQWKLGDQRRDDGLILIVAVDDRKVRIEVGYGLEGVIPDALAAKVIRHQLNPHFKAGDFEAGISTAFATLMRAAEGEAVRVGPPKEKRKVSSLFRPLIWLIAILFFMFVGRGGGAGGGRRGNHFGTLGGLGMGLGGGRSFGGGGFGGGGFGGGGFGGGGGGGFGGGGSSGGW